MVQICPEGTFSDSSLKKTKSKGGTVEGERKQIVPTRLLPNKKNIKGSLESCSYILTCCAAFCFVVLRGKLHGVHPGEHIIIHCRFILPCSRSLHKSLSEEQTYLTLLVQRVERKEFPEDSDGLDLNSP